MSGSPKGMKNVKISGKGDIPERIHKELLKEQEGYGGIPIYRLIGAALDIWILLPDTVRRFIVVLDRENALFAQVASEIGSRLVPMAQGVGFRGESVTVQSGPAGSAIETAVEGAAVPGPKPAIAPRAASGRSAEKKRAGA